MEPIVRCHFDLIRLGALPLSLTLLSILAGSIVNRVMVVELGLPVILAGLFVAIPLLVSPLRVWLGHLSDAYPLFGRRREPYLMLGAVLSGLGAAGAILLVVQQPERASLASVLILAALVLYGVGRNLAGNTFQALLADRFAPGVPRSRAANLYEVVKLIGMVIGAGLVGLALRPYSTERLILVVTLIALAAVVLSILAAWGQEPRGEPHRVAMARARASSFWTRFHTLVWSDPQARRFILVITLTLLGTQMQDVLMEPYAGLVLGMDVAATTQLTMFWGLGALSSILLSGLLLIPWLGLARLFRLGVLLLVPLFPLVILAGLLQEVWLLRASVLAMGLSSGLAAASLLAQTLAFTSLASAGLLLGVWGLGHQLGRALASLLGAGVVDLMNRLTTGQTLIAYGTAFMLEAALLLGALLVFGRLRIESAQALAECEDRSASE
ncbi:MAG: MFS transporter [Sphingobacteriia bacterium]|nr:MFS transporter [Sphingobacteriia bacterium]NCC39390.1 MFS transporter [Gammaproteobacteria bacterium]